jgi:hypothetical protein
MASRVVRAADADSLFSHVGIVDVQGKSPRVIHSAPAGEGSAAGGVISEPLSQFLSAGNATMAGIYRLKNEESAIPVRALDLAREYLYRAAPFDGSFDLADQEAVYCTEFIWAVYAGAGVDLSAGRFDRLEVPFKTDVDFILPSTLTKSADLESIEILTFEEW